MSDPSFISLHYHHSPSFLLLRLFRELTTKPFYCSLPPRRDDSLKFTHFKRSLTPFPRHSSINAVCNGLIYLGSRTRVDFCSSSFVIYNPSLRRYLSIPKPESIPEPQIHHSVTVALGFDSKNRDYKILRIVFGGNNYPEERFLAPYSRVELYSVASRLWRNLSLPPMVAPPCTISRRRRPIASHGFVNSFAHWGARRRATKEGNNKVWFFFILFFDFIIEGFHEIALPERISHASSPWVLNNAVKGGNALTVYHVSCHVPCKGIIWAMKEYSVVVSWTELFTFDLNGFSLNAPSLGITVIYVTIPPESICINDNGDMLLLVYYRMLRKGRLYLLDVEKKTLVDRQIEADAFY